MEIHDETTVTQSSRCRTEMHTCRQGLFRPVWAEEILQLVHECGSSQAGSAVQIFHPTACCSCGRRMLWMCPRHIFSHFFKTLPSFSSEVQASASVKGFWLHFSTCGRGARRASLLCRFLPCLATFMKPI